MRSIGGHIVICGLSRMGYLLASQFSRHGDRVVVIEKHEENIWLESCRGENIPVLVGDAADPGLLKRAGAASARTVAPGLKFQNPLWAVKFPVPTAVYLSNSIPSPSKVTGNALQKPGKRERIRDEIINRGGVS